VKGGILAAGEGSRLQTAGGGVLKPLVEVGGRALLLRAADNLVAAGVSSLHVIVNARAAEARDRLLAEPWPVPVKVTIMSTPSSLHSLAALAPEFGEEPALVSMVDTIVPPGTATALAARARARRRSDATLAITAFVDDELPLSVRLHGDRIRELGTGLPRARWATAGLYCFAPVIWPEVARAVEGATFRMRNFLGRLVADGFRLHALRVPQTIDVDRPRDVEMAERCLARWERAR
jgi:choline kinase